MLPATIEIVKSKNFLVLDTETTGLGPDAEICQIAVINGNGNVLLNTLVRPSRAIPHDAMRIHGITNERVADAPSFADIANDLEKVLYGSHLFIYNAEYDLRLLCQSDPKRANWWAVPAATVCVMNAFSPIYGEWNDYHGNYRWQKLTTAARYYNVQVQNAHDALGDCLMTLGVLRAMCEVQP